MKKVLFSILLGLLSVNAFADFSGDYDVANWTQVLDGGSIDVSGAPASVIAMSSNASGGGIGPPSNTDFTIASVADGNVTFDWSYTTADGSPNWDPFGWLLNGAFTQVTNNAGGNNQNGTVTFPVNAGDVFGFRANSFDSGFGAATTTITNFSAPVAAVLPQNIPTLSTWGIIFLSLFLMFMMNNKGVLQRRILGK